LSAFGFFFSLFPFWAFDTAILLFVRKELPGIDIQKTCKAAAGAMVSLMGGTTTEQDINACLDSEQKARDQIVKDRATYSAADKRLCMRTDVYLPSYVEWITCLEMERDVRKMDRGPQFGAGPWTLPKVNPAINAGGRWVEWNFPAEGNFCIWPRALPRCRWGNVDVGKPDIHDHKIDLPGLGGL
jgi:hypothetical protein